MQKNTASQSKNPPDTKGAERARIAVAKFLDDTPKATLKTMKTIITRFGDIPSKIIGDDGALEYNIISQLIFAGVSQIDQAVTQDEMENAIDMGNIEKAIKATTYFLQMRISDALVPVGDPVESDTESKNVT